jgi:hypothetical protein
MMIKQLTTANGQNEEKGLKRKESKQRKEIQGRSRKYVMDRKRKQRKYAENRNK